MATSSTTNVPKIQYYLLAPSYNALRTAPSRTNAFQVADLGIQTEGDGSPWAQVRELRVANANLKNQLLTISVIAGSAILSTIVLAAQNYFSGQSVPNKLSDANIQLVPKNDTLQTIFNNTQNITRVEQQSPKPANVSSAVFVQDPDLLKELQNKTDELTGLKQKLNTTSQALNDALDGWNATNTEWQQTNAELDKCKEDLQTCNNEKQASIDSAKNAATACESEKNQLTTDVATTKAKAKQLIAQYKKDRDQLVEARDQAQNTWKECVTGLTDCAAQLAAAKQTT